MGTIGVIVPVYRVEPYLRRCVDSLLGQSDADFKLVLVDDGSPDSCGAICDEYAKSDARVHVLHQENKGLSEARNAGIDWVLNRSDCEWLSFVDSDDWVHPRYLEALRRQAESNNTDIVICGYEKTGGEPLPEVSSFDVVIWKTSDYYLKKSVNATVAWGKLYHRRCFQDIRFPAGRIHEDEFVTYRILFRYEYISVVDAPLYAYYQNDAGITRSQWNEKRMDGLSALEGQVRFFADRGYMEIARARFRSMINNNMNCRRQVLQSTIYKERKKARLMRKLRHQLGRMLIRYRRYEFFPYRDSERNKRIYRDTFPVFRAVQRQWWNVREACAKLRGKLRRG